MAKHDIRTIALLFVAFWSGALFDRAVQNARNIFLISTESLMLLLSLIVVLYMNKKIAR